MRFTTSVALAALATLARVSGHMFIQSPTPIPNSSPKDPLDPSGSNFPCHGVALPSSGGEKMAAGSSQVLSLALGDGANTAVHGGGSCQMSITYETDPVKVKDPKNWKVIYSIEGGCPSNTKGNLDNGVGAIACTTPGQTDCVNSYNFTVPKGVKSGHAIMAWTWFNTIGGREMYMNCINTQITGGDGSEMNSLPSMFTANVASVSSCATSESSDVKFPNPGKYTFKGKSQYSLGAPTGECGGGSGGAGPAPEGYSQTPSTPIPPPSYAAPEIGKPHVKSGGSNNQAPSASAPPPPSSDQTTTPPVGTPSGPSGAVSFSSGACRKGQVPCTKPGDLVCVGRDSFGICDADKCAVAQPVARGTVCRNGVITKRDHVHRHLAKRGIGAHSHS